LWDTAQNAPDWSLRNSFGAVVVGWTDDTLLALCSAAELTLNQTRLCRFDEAGGTLVQPEVLLWRHPGEVNSPQQARLSASGDWLAFTLAQGDAQPQVYAFHLRTGAQHAVDSAAPLAFQPGTDMLTARDYGGALVTFTPETGVQTVDARFGPPLTGLAYNRDGSLLAATGAGERGQVNVWRDGEPVTALHPQIAGAVRWLDAERLVTRGEMAVDGPTPRAISVWDAADGDRLRAIDGAANAVIAAWDTAFERVATSDGTGFFTVDGQRHISTAGMVVALAWSPDSTRVASLSERDDRLSIEIWEASGSLVSQVDLHEVVDYAPRLYWSNDGSQVAFSSVRSADWPYMLDVFDTADGSHLWRYETTQIYAPLLAWGPGDRWLAVEILSGVTFLAGATGAPHPAQIAQGYIGALAWHPDGTEFATGGQDGLIRLWDVGVLQ
jgi:WD40 repeat protein